MTKSTGVWGLTAVAVAAAGGTAALAWAGVLPLPAQVVLYAEAKAASKDENSTAESKPDSYKLPTTGLKGLPKEVR